MELSQKSLSNLQIFITYQEENDIVVFNKGDWEINIILSYYEKHHKANKKSNFTIHKDIEQMFNKYNTKTIDTQKQQQELNELIGILNKKNQQQK